MIGEKLAGIYASLEEKWYNLLDFLENKGIPVGTYSNFLEGKGIPSFPFTLGIIILIIAILFVLFTATSGVSLTVQISIKDDAGNGVNGVHLVVTDSKNTVLKDTSVNAISTIDLGNVPVGADLIFSATKDGYDVGMSEFQVTNISENIEIVLERLLNYIDATIKLANKDTSDPITNAIVKLVSENKEYIAIPQDDGTFFVSGIPQNEDIKIIVEADGYETYEDIYSFKEGETKQIPLSPKSISFAGKTNLLIDVLDIDTSIPIKDVQIKIINSKTNGMISELKETDGQFTGKIETGTSIKWIVSKEGYLSEEGGPETLVSGERKLKVFLKKGGEELNVYLLNQMEFPIAGGTAGLYNEKAEFLDSNVTGISGSVKFQGLDPNKIYYITGHKDGFLPARKKISVSDIKSISLKLEPINGENSATLLIRVLDLQEKSVNNADVVIYEILDNETLPMGYASLKTDLTGKTTVIAPVGKTLLVKASKGFDEGNETIVMQKGATNEITVYIAPKATLITLNLKDEKGKAIEGIAKIISVTGDILFDGNVKDGKVIFEPKENETGILQLTFDDDSTYEEQLDFKEQKGKEMEVTIYKDAAELAPKIEYLGIVDDKGNEVTGITKEKYYWLKFQLTSVPNMSETGVHIRVGKDNVKFVDSQAIAIYGFDSTAQKFTLGRTYSPIPEPGSEGIDRKNIGSNGKANKWLDLVYKNAADVEIIKVKVLAMQTLQEEEFEVHYRAWTNIKNEYYRTPHDDILDKAKSSQKRNPLYAETLTQTVKVFDKEEYVCKESFCLTYVFYDEFGNKYAEQEFSPTVNKSYAVEFTIFSNEDGTAKGILSTNAKEPSLSYSGWIEGSFVNIPATSNKVYDLSFDSAVSQKEGKKITAFFLPDKVGSTYINLKLASGEKVLEKNLLVNITEEGILNIATKPNAIALGKPFWIVVSDAASGKLLENLTIVMTDDKGKNVSTIAGNGTKDKGLNGEYAAGSGLQTGLYHIEINNPKYKKAVKDILVSKDDLLFIQPEVKVNLGYGEQAKAEKLQVENKSIFNISAITYELQTDSEFDNNFSVNLAVMSAIDAEKKGMFDLTVTYKGDKESRIHSEAELIIRGMVNGLFPVQATTKLILNYNKELEEDCLEIEQKQVAFSLVGTTGTQSKEKIKLINKCKETLNLKTDIEGLKSNSGLEIGAPAFALKAGEEKEIELTAINKIDRMYSQALQQAYKLYFKSAQLTKSIPLMVILRHPLYLLMTNNNIVMWLNEKDNKWEANAQLYMRNVGEKPIRFIRFTTLNRPQSIFIETSNYLQNYMANPNPWDTGSVGQSYFGAMNQMYNTGMPAGSNSGYLSPQYDQFGTNTNNLGYPNSSNQALGGGYPYSSGLNQNSLYGSTGTGYPFFAQNMTLLPGQELMPPATINVKANSIKELQKGPLQASIMIMGNIEGRDYPLRVVNVWLYVTGTECLRVVAKESLDFESKESKEGVMTKDLEISNMCAEELTSLTLETTNLGANKLSINMPGTMIGPGQKIDAQLVLEKAGDYSTGESPLKTKVKALMVRSQQFTYSAPLDISVLLGEKFAAKGKATLAENLQICDEKEGKTKSVKYPLINNKDCGEGYCDAESMAAYLLKRADEKINLVKKRIKDAQNDARNFSCARTDFCTFPELGVSSSSVGAFLQNDSVTEDLLQHIIEKDYMNLKGFVVRARDISAEELSSAFEIRTVLISSNMMGCGKYKITISGGAQRTGNKLNEEDLSVVISVEKESITEECQPRVQNTLNFMPKDLSLNPENSFNTWLGTVSLTEEGLSKENKEDLKNIALEFARNLFNSEKRYGEYNSNVLRVTLGDAGGALMKITMDTGYDPDMPEKREVTVTINKEYLNVAEPEKKKQILAEIAAAIKSVASQKYTGCISEDEGTLLIKDLPEGIGSIALKPAERKLGLRQKNESCVDFNVLGIIKDMEVEMHSNWESLEGKSGISDVYFKDMKGKKLKEYGDVANGTSIKLSEKGEKGEYYHTIKFCAIGSEERITLATGTQLTIKARSTSIAKLESNESIIKIEDCGIDPITLMKKIKERMKTLKNGEFVDTYVPNVSWNCNSSDVVPIGKLANYFTMGFGSGSGNAADTNAGSAVGNGSAAGNPTVAAQGNVTPNVPYMQQKEAEKFNNSLLKYTMHCAWASGACNAAIGFWRGGPILGALSGIALDCALPAGIAKYASGNKTAKDAAAQVTEWLKNVPDPSTGFGGPAVLPESQMQQLNMGNLSEEQYRTLLGTSIIGTTTQSLIMGMRRYNAYLSTKNYNDVANKMYAQAKKAFNAELFDGKAPKKVLNEFEKIYQSKIKAAVEKAAKSWYSKPAKLTEQSIAAIANEATSGLDAHAFDDMTKEIINLSKTGGKFDIVKLKKLSPKLGTIVDDAIKGAKGPSNMAGYLVEQHMKKGVLEGLPKTAQKTIDLDPARAAQLEAALTATPPNLTTAASIYDGFLDDVAKAKGRDLAEAMVNNLEKSAGTSLSQASRKELVDEFMAKAVPILKGGAKYDVGGTGKDQAKKLLKALFELNQGANISIQNFTMSIGNLDITAATQQMTKIKATFPKDLLESAVGAGGSGMVSKIDDSIIKQLGDLMIEITDVDGTVKKVKLSEVGDLSKKAEDALKKAFTEGDAAGKAVKSTEAKWWKKVKPKNFLKLLAKPGFWLDMGLGLGCGLAANLAGYYLGFKPTWEEMTQEEDNSIPIIVGSQGVNVDKDGDGKPDLQLKGEDNIMKGNSYVVTVGKDSKGKPYIAFKKVDSKPETAKEEIEMDCTGAYKDVKPVFGGLNVPATAGNALLDAYKQHEAELISAVSLAKQYNSKNEINEALLASLAITGSGFGTFNGSSSTSPKVDLDGDSKVDYIVACGASTMPGRDNVPKNDSQKDFLCAAYEMSRLEVLKNNAIDESALAEYYNNISPQYRHSLISNVNSYVANVKAIYNTWKGYQIE
ncbi:MAG: hypothetical protein AABW72_00100 [archaeon]